MDEKYKREPYESRFKPQLDQLYSKLQNREPFKYDVNGDALYQMYKNQAISGGKLAMQDTMGNAQAMTGGYGNTYAQNVGQQAYNGYMMGLAGKVPELARTAYEMYEREGDKLKGQIGMLEGLEGKDYDRYIDNRNMQMQDEDRAIRDREAAYTKLMQLMQLGYKPNADEMAAAGLTQPQVDAIWSKLNPVMGGDGGYDIVISKPKKPGDDEDPKNPKDPKSGTEKRDPNGWYRYEDYKKRVDNLYGSMSAGGATEAQKNAVLTNAVNNWNVNPWDAVEIAKKHK